MATLKMMHNCSYIHTIWIWFKSTEVCYQTTEGKKERQKTFRLTTPKYTGKKELTHKGKCVCWLHISSIHTATSWQIVNCIASCWMWGMGQVAEIRENENLSGLKYIWTNIFPWQKLDRGVRHAFPALCFANLIHIILNWYSSRDSDLLLIFTYGFLFCCPVML